MPLDPETLGRPARSEGRGPAELAHLLRQLQDARATVAALRSQARGLAANPEQSLLLDALRGYVSALEARNLPVPPAIRDELALQRCLVSAPGSVRVAASRRRAVRR
jgi:hypothetical protein